MSQAEKVKQTPVIVRPFSAPKGLVPLETLMLSPQEMVDLRVLLNSPVFIKAMVVAETKKPSAFTDKDATTEDKVERLAEIRAWEACQSSLFLQAQIEKYDFNKRGTTPYSWPDQEDK